MSDVENVVKEEAQGDLPEWARKQISDANAEAAKYRTEKRDAVEAAKREVEESYEAKVKDLEDSLAAQKDQTIEAQRAVDRLKVALEAGIASDKVTRFAELLDGESEDEMRSKAEELKELFEPVKAASQRAVDTTQGRVPSTPLNGDPLLDAVMRKMNLK